jgi:Flp pilus assembly pilin Flp
MVVSMRARRRLNRTAQYVRRRAVRLIRDERGQDLIEYALLTAIVAVAWVLAGPPLIARMATAYQSWAASANDPALTNTPAPIP